MTSNERKSHAIARDLADYVLGSHVSLTSVWTTRWAGMYGDDIAKSPHMARIGGSVYSDVDPNTFFVDGEGKPSPVMEESLLWKLHHYRQQCDGGC